MAECMRCAHCKFPRTADDNAGNCKCKLMKYKTIDALVCEGETPDWCPLNKRGSVQAAILGRVIDGFAGDLKGGEEG